jgi:hypothetical protein
MVGVWLSDLVNNPVVQKSLARLKAMGLDVRVLPESRKEVFIFITLKSICKLIEKQITFINKSVSIEGEYMVIYLWKKAGEP